MASLEDDTAAAIEEEIWEDLDLKSLDDLAEELLDGPVSVSDMIRQMMEDGKLGDGGEWIRIIRGALGSMVGVQKKNWTHILLLVLAASLLTGFTDVFQNRQISEISFYMIFVFFFVALLKIFQGFSSQLETTLSVSTQFMKALRSDSIGRDYHSRSGLSDDLTPGIYRRTYSGENPAPGDSYLSVDGTGQSADRRTDAFKIYRASAGCDSMGTKDYRGSGTGDTIASENGRSFCGQFPADTSGKNGGSNSGSWKSVQWGDRGSNRFCCITAKLSGSRSNHRPCTGGSSAGGKAGCQYGILLSGIRSISAGCR